MPLYKVSTSRESSEALVPARVVLGHSQGVSTEGSFQLDASNAMLFEGSEGGEHVDNALSLETQPPPGFGIYPNLVNPNNISFKTNHLDTAVSSYNSEYKIRYRVLKRVKVHYTYTVDSIHYPSAGIEAKRIYYNRNSAEAVSTYTNVTTGTSEVVEEVGSIIEFTYKYPANQDDRNHENYMTVDMQIKSLENNTVYAYFDHPTQITQILVQTDGAHDYFSKVYDADSANGFPQPTNANVTNADGVTSIVREHSNRVSFLKLTLKDAVRYRISNPNAVAPMSMRFGFRALNAYSGVVAANSGRRVQVRRRQMDVLMASMSKHLFLQSFNSSVLGGSFFTFNGHIIDVELSTLIKTDGTLATDQTINVPDAFAVFGFGLGVRVYYKDSFGDFRQAEGTETPSTTQIKIYYNEASNNHHLNNNNYAYLAATSNPTILYQLGSTWTPLRLMAGYEDGFNYRSANMKWKAISVKGYDSPYLGRTATYSYIDPTSHTPFNNDLDGNDLGSFGTTVALYMNYFFSGTNYNRRISVKTNSTDKYVVGEIGANYTSSLWTVADKVNIKIECHSTMFVHKLLFKNTFGRFTKFSVKIKRSSSTLNLGNIYAPGNQWAAITVNANISSSDYIVIDDFALDYYNLQTQQNVNIAYHAYKTNYAYGDYNVPGNYSDYCMYGEFFLVGSDGYPASPYDSVFTGYLDEYAIDTVDSALPGLRDANRLDYGSSVANYITDQDYYFPLDVTHNTSITGDSLSTYTEYDLELAESYNTPAPKLFEYPHKERSYKIPGGFSFGTHRYTVGGAAALTDVLDTGEGLTLGQYLSHFNGLFYRVYGRSYTDNVVDYDNVNDVGMYTSSTNAGSEAQELNMYITKKPASVWIKDSATDVNIGRASNRVSEWSHALCPVAIITDHTHVLDVRLLNDNDLSNQNSSISTHTGTIFVPQAVPDNYSATMYQQDNYLFRHPDVVNLNATITLKVNDQNFSRLTTEVESTFQTYKKIILSNRTDSDTNASFHIHNTKNVNNAREYVYSDISLTDIIMTFLQNGKTAAFTAKGIDTSVYKETNGFTSGIKLNGDSSTHGNAVSFDYYGNVGSLSSSVTVKKVAD